MLLGTIELGVEGMGQGGGIEKGNNLESNRSELSGLSHLQAVQFGQVTEAR